MTPTEFHEIRKSLCLSAAGLARVLGVPSLKTVQRWEYGQRAIPPTVATLLTGMMTNTHVRNHFMRQHDKRTEKPD